MPNIPEAVECIMGCVSMGINFEFVQYGLGLLGLKQSMRQLKPSLIITSSCSVESDGIHSNKKYVDKVKKITGNQGIQCVVFQRETKKIKLKS